MKSVAVLACATAFLMPTFAAEQGAVGDACKADIKKLCPDVKPGQGAVVKCLKTHEDQVSPGCKSAIKEAAGKRGPKKS